MEFKINFINYILFNIFNRYEFKHFNIILIMLEYQLTYSLFSYNLY